MANLNTDRFLYGLDITYSCNVNSGTNVDPSRLAPLAKELSSDYVYDFLAFAEGFFGSTMGVSSISETIDVEAVGDVFKLT